MGMIATLIRSGIFRSFNRSPGNVCVPMGMDFTSIYFICSSLHLGALLKTTTRPGLLIIVGSTPQGASRSRKVAIIRQCTIPPWMCDGLSCAGMGSGQPLRRSRTLRQAQLWFRLLTGPLPQNSRGVTLLSVDRHPLVRAAQLPAFLAGHGQVDSRPGCPPRRAGRLPCCLFPYAGCTPPRD